MTQEFWMWLSFHIPLGQLPCYRDQAQAFLAIYSDCDDSLSSVSNGDPDHILGSLWHKQPSQFRLSHFLLLRFSVRMFPTYAWPSLCLAFLPTPLQSFSRSPPTPPAVWGVRDDLDTEIQLLPLTSFLLATFLSRLHTFLDRNLLHVFSTGWPREESVK